MLQPASYTFTTAGSKPDNGVHTFNATLDTAGNQTITANDGITGTSGFINVAPGAPAKVQFGTLSPSVTAGATVNPSFTVKDGYGNSWSGNVTVTPILNGVSLPSRTVTVTGGTGTFQDTLTRAGTMQYSVTAGGVTGSSSTIVVNRAAPQFNISGLPSSMNVGQNATISITVSDAYGNLYTGTSLTISSSNSSAASLSSGMVTTNSNGQANVTLNAIHSGNVNGASVNLTISGGGGSKSVSTTVMPTLFTTTFTVVIAWQPPSYYATDEEGDEILVDPPQQQQTFTQTLTGTLGGVGDPNSLLAQIDAYVEHWELMVDPNLDMGAFVANQGRSALQPAN
jgi:hypothetical protein